MTTFPQALSHLVQDAAKGAEDVFAQVGIELTPAELGRILICLAEIVAKRPPVTPRVAELIKLRATR